MILKDFLQFTRLKRKRGKWCGKRNQWKFGAPVKILSKRILQWDGEGILIDFTGNDFWRCFSSSSCKTFEEGSGKAWYARTHAQKSFAINFNAIDCVSRCTMICWKFLAHLPKHYFYVLSVLTIIDLILHFITLF